MTRNTVESCEILFQDGRAKVGVYANAFRVVPDVDKVFFLDFLVFVKEDNVAYVVSRIRVTLDMLGVITDSLTKTLLDLDNLQKAGNTGSSVLVHIGGETHYAAPASDEEPS